VTTALKEPPSWTAERGGSALPADAPFDEIAFQGRLRSGAVKGTRVQPVGYTETCHARTAVGLKPQQA